LEQLEEHDDVALEWHAFELRPAGAPPISPERQARILAGRPLLQKRAREQYGLELNPGPVGANSRPALVLEKYAQTQGKGAAFHVAAMRAYWEQGRDIGDTAVLRAVAQEVSLNTKDFEQILASEAFHEQVTADEEMAHAYRLTGVPALIFADRYLVMGAQPYQVLKQIVERVREEEKDGGEGERESGGR
jgi:predicted DsbA family dithiol-disulfide isomerase